MYPSNVTKNSYILRRPQNFAKSPPYFCLKYIQTKLRRRFRKILWPSQNIWTLNPWTRITDNMKRTEVFIGVFISFSFAYVGFLLVWLIHDGDFAFSQKLDNLLANYLADWKILKYLNFDVTCCIFWKKLHSSSTQSLVPNFLKKCQSSRFCLQNCSQITMWCLFWPRSLSV